MAKRRGQISMEFLLVTGFALLILMPTIYLFSLQLQGLRTDANVREFTRAMNELDAAMREVCYMGSGARQVVSIYFPLGFQGINTTNSNIVMYNYSNPPNEIVIPKKIPCNASINIPRVNGLVKITITNQGGLLNVTT
ncbi:hypothetical protein J7K74_00695 [Candidatus Woesearchaeota archaeon]|nr:hypothetical protein [Candidatus Woesearchaeota archaeon]